MARLLIAGLIGTAPLPAQGPPLWGRLKPGPHPVGYRRADLAGGRLHIWFPARHGRGALLEAGAYYDSADPALPARVLEATTAAHRDAAAAGGPFPLVLYAAPSANANPDNTVLAEYLASHGYVVVAAPGGTRGLDAALGAVAGFSYVRPDTVAIVSRGDGWIAAVEFAAGRPAVRAILGLDPPPDGPDAVAPGRPLAVLRLRAEPLAAGTHGSDRVPAPSAGITITIPRSTAGSFGDRAAHLDLLDAPDDAAPDHRRLIAGVAHAFLDGSLRAWGPSLQDLAARLSRAGLEVTGARPTP